MRYASLLPLALLVGCATTDRPVSDTPTTTVVTPAPRAFDVPALLGLNVEQIDRPLSNSAARPEHDRTPRLLASGETESRYTYWHDTTALVVSYNPATLKVTSYFVKTKHGLTSDYSTLLRLVGVSKYDKRLSIEPVASAEHPELYTGVNIIPNQ
jgi:hypothetical protein